MEPAPDEIRAWTSIADVVQWAGLPGTVGDLASPLGALMQMLGTDGAEHWRVLAFMPKAVFEEAVGRWEAAGVAPSPTQVSQAGLIGYGTRVAAGIRDPPPSGPVPTPPPTGLTLDRKARTFRLAEVVDQAMDGDGEIMTQDDLAAAFKE